MLATIRYLLPIVLLISGTSAFGQVQTALEFEVATVKPKDTSAVPYVVGVEIYEDGRLSLKGFTLHGLIATAFDKPFWQISLPEGWMTKDEFEIMAKPPASARTTNRRHTLYGIDDERLRRMLQALLVERFQLKIRTETKSGDVYVLSRTDKPFIPRERPLASEEEANRAVGSIGYAAAKWNISASTMAELAAFASSYVLRAPVIDRTGLTARFDYRQRDPDQEPVYGGDNTDSFLRFLSEAGLKLEKTRGPVENLVVESASKPSEN